MPTSMGIYPKERIRRRGKAVCRKMFATTPAGHAENGLLLWQAQETRVDRFLQPVRSFKMIIKKANQQHRDMGERKPDAELCVGTVAIMMWKYCVSKVTVGRARYTG